MAFLEEELEAKVSELAELTDVNQGLRSRILEQEEVLGSLVEE